MMRILILAFISLITSYVYSQNYEYKNGQWLLNGKFQKKQVYSINKTFSFNKPKHIDSVIDLKNMFCIPPFADAHTHTIDGSYFYNDIKNQYNKEGVFYVQVLGNHGKQTQQARMLLAKDSSIDVSFANGLLTSTYGHGFYPYEPLALNIYVPRDQIRLADSIKKSRRMENDAYYFFDNISDVESKWPLVMKYKPDILKICLMDAKNYATLRAKEIPDTYGLSPEVAEYVVKKSHAEGLRVFAHVETVDDALLCARIGVDGLAHLPGYGWNGTIEDSSKFCLSDKDIKILKKSGIAIIPTVNINHTDKYDDAGNKTSYPDRSLRTYRYEQKTLRALYKEKIPIGLGADYYGKTVWLEFDSVRLLNIFKPAELLDIACRQTAQIIFPQRKIGEIKEGYEASFLVLNADPLNNIAALRNTMVARIKQGRFLTIKD